MRPGCQRRDMPENELYLFSGRVIAGVLPEAPAQEDIGRQAHLVHCLFDALRGHSQHYRPVCRPSPAPILSRYCRQSCSEGVSGEKLSRIDDIVIFHLFVELSWLLSCRSKRGTRLLSLASWAAYAGLAPRQRLSCTLVCKDQLLDLDYKCQGFGHCNNCNSCNLLFPASSVKYE